MIVCDNCQRNYRRKISAYENAWNCSTYLRFGKSACPAKKVPEDIIMSLAATALKLKTFDPEIFKERVREIRVLPNNMLRFALRDGESIDCEWKDKSRSASWTPEMRAQAAKVNFRRYAV